MDTDTVIRINEYLALSNKEGNELISCTACGKDICPGKADWRKHVIRRERPLSKVVPLVAEHPAVYLDELICPGCGAMLETQIVVHHDPGAS